MSEEVCLPWPAIPDSANKYSNLDIMEVAHTRRPDRPNLSVVVASSWPEHPPTFTGAWRINFKGVLVYRLRLYGYAAGNLPLKRLDPTSALWEISPSNYFAQEDPRKAALPDDVRLLRHYVICTGANEVFETIAWHWSVEQLGDEWAHPFSTAPEP